MREVEDRRATNGAPRLYLPSAGKSPLATQILRACSSVRTPLARSSGFVNSLGAWAWLPTLGTNMSAVGTCAASATASWPHTVLVRIQVIPHAVAARSIREMPLSGNAMDGRISVPVTLIRVLDAASISVNRSVSCLAASRAFSSDSARISR